MVSSEEKIYRACEAGGQSKAPGEGSAEPGEPNPKRRRSHEVCDRWWKVNELLGIHHDSETLVTNRLSPASQALAHLAKLTPGSAKPSPGALLCPPASQARLMHSSNLSLPI